MNLINDVKNDLKQLEINSKSLRNFSFVLSASALVLVWIFYKENIFSAYWIFIILAFIILVSIKFSQLLKRLYVFWMGIGIVIGWFISRIILIIVFFLIIVPTGFIARIFGKKFIDLEIKTDSYWIKRKKPYIINYKKMY